jgi:MraZ protein
MKGDADMFCGQFAHSLDEKNRFKVPAAMRDELGSKTYLIKSPDSDTRCIFVYSEEGWNELYREFNQGNEHNQAMRRLARKILSSVISGDVDKGGRLTLNALLKEYAGIDNEVCIVGNNNHIEIWSPEEWAKEEAIMEEQSTDSLNINF